MRRERALLLRLPSALALAAGSPSPRAKASCVGWQGYYETPSRALLDDGQDDQDTRQGHAEAHGDGLGELVAVGLGF